LSFWQCLWCCHMTQIISRANPIHLHDECRTAPSGSRPSKPTNLGCESACRLLVSTSSIIIYYYAARQLMLIFPSDVKMSTSMSEYINQIAIIQIANIKSSSTNEHSVEQRHLPSSLAWSTAARRSKHVEIFNRYVGLSPAESRHASLLTGQHICHCPTTAFSVTLSRSHNSRPAIRSAREGRRGKAR